MGQWSWAILAFEKELNSRAPVKDLVDPFSYFGSVEGFLKHMEPFEQEKLLLKNNVKMKRLFSVLALLACACQTPKEADGGWQKVFQNSAEGEVIFGDKSALLDAVRLGYPIRIGWGSNRVEHVADAEFLTIFEGEEVFAQIQSIIGQAPRIDNDSLKIRFRTQNHWTKIAGTNGYSTGLMTDYLNHSIAGGGTDRYTATTWYVLYPNHRLDIEARPLWRKESPNWEKWQKKENK